MRVGIGTSFSAKRAIPGGARAHPGAGIFDFHRRVTTGGKGGRLAKPERELIKNMTDGVRSPGAPMAMPPKGGDPSLTEQDIAAACSTCARRSGASGTRRWAT